ncbi:MAG: hypothetical protein GY943_27225 [Chloroflexi bacterium]|nr:hypothetical protein [Chloroflexota bacterium]
MIAPFKQTSALFNLAERVSILPIIAVVTGIGFGFLFAQLWSGYAGLAALALWPLGLAMGLILTTLVASLVSQVTNWDLLIAGKVLALIGILLFFISSL